MDAYHAYRRGYDYIYNPDSTAENIQFAIDMFQQAVALDPQYAQAHAYLCIAHANMYWYGWDFTPERIASAKAALDHAVALRKNDPETPLAEANYRYHCLLDYDGALDACQRSIQRQPSFAVPLFISAMIMRRQGRFVEAFDSCRQALKLDPLRLLIVGETGSTALYMRRYDEAAGYYERSIALAPDRVQARALLSALELQGRGDVVKARRLLEEMKHRGPVEAFLEWCDLLFVDRDLSKMLAFIDHCGQNIFEDQALHAPKSWFIGEAHRLLGNPEDAKPHYLKAVTYLEPRLAQNPQDDRLANALAFAHVGLGRDADAARLIAGVVERTPISRDAINGAIYLMFQAAVHAGMGDSTTALPILNTILNYPCQISSAYLRVHPYWDKLRGLPEFERLANLPPKVF
jgi:tetratricopeptide (TPR) repeat protein